jgi:hypothetical protein
MLYLIDSGAKVRIFAQLRKKCARLVSIETVYFVTNRRFQGELGKSKQMLIFVPQY